MKKRRFIWALIIVFSLAIVTFLVKDPLAVEKDHRSPAHFSSYPNSGSFTFNPETILESLEQGKTDVFAPYFGDPDTLEQDSEPITWSESDYLKVVGALSKKIWGESLDPKNWGVESVYFAQNCNNNPKGFNRFNIVYYKDLGVTNWTRTYTTRYIDIQPWRGLTNWGGNATFASSLLSGWHRIDLGKFVVSADNALQLAEERGGKQADKIHCNTISVSMYQGDQETWDVTYFAANFGMRINAKTGKYQILDTGR